MSSESSKKLLSNIKYSVLSQMTVLVIGIVKVLLLPIVLGVTNYGYWQIYALYTAYVGLFGLGFIDGIYLKYGEFAYEELPLKNIRSSMLIYLLMLLFMTLIVLFFIKHEIDPFKRIALFYSASNILIMGLIGAYIFIFQITNRIIEYSFFNLLDKLLFLVFLIVLILKSEKGFIYYVFFEVISKLICLLVMLIRNKEILFGSLTSIKIAFAEFFENIKIGVNLLIANLAGMLVLGVGRFYMEGLGDINEFAYYSFGMSITNLVLICVSGVSLVLYPALKRVSMTQYRTYFSDGNYYLHIFATLILVLYFPIYAFIDIYFTDYSSMLFYLNVLFVVTILQSKMQLLNNTYYKALREEKAMSLANIVSVILAIFFTFAFHKFYPFTKSVAVAIMVTMMYRVYASEYFLRKKMNMPLFETFRKELIVILGFVFITEFFDPIMGSLIYVVCAGVYLILNKQKIKLIIANSGKVT